MSAALDVSELDKRRRELGMTVSALAGLSKVSIPTVRRILSGRHPNPTFANVSAIAEALGLSVSLVPRHTAAAVRKRQALRKARHLTRLVQGTSALEGQAVGTEALDRMTKRAVGELLKGSKRRLWAE